MTKLTSTARNMLCAGAAALALAASPASAHSYSFSFDDHEDLLEQLIALDADGIADLRSDLQEAQADVADAIEDIAEAREEVKEVPFGGLIARIAFSAAKASVSEATDIAIDEIREELNLAEEELGARRNDLGEAEFNETSGAIAMIQEELDGLEAVLDELVEALS